MSDCCHSDCRCQKESENRKIIAEILSHHLRYKGVAYAVDDKYGITMYKWKEGNPPLWEKQGGEIFLEDKILAKKELQNQMEIFEGFLSEEKISPDDKKLIIKALNVEPLFFRPDNFAVELNDQLITADKIIYLNDIYVIKSAENGWYMGILDDQEEKVQLWGNPEKTLEKMVEKLKIRETN